MTYRAKPVVRPRRRPWEGPEGRTFLTNLGFTLVVVIALLVLVVYAAAAWYNDHLAAVGSVNGQSITRDELNRRLEVESTRLSIAESRIADEVNAGRLTQEQGNAQRQIIEQQRQQIGAIALERLIDARVQEQLAEREGVAVTDADVEAQITEEATHSAQREAWIIEVEPEVEDDAEEPTQAAITAARTAAEDARAEIEGGADWEEVAKEVSTDSTAPIGGSLGWINEQSNLEQPFLDALFALEEGEMTEVIEGEDGIFRVGRVTGIVEEAVDPNYLALVADRGVPEEVYREAVRQDVFADKLREKIESQALAEGPQREVEHIYLENQSLPEELPQGSVKTRHILYSPDDDPQGAAELEDDDPAWDEAEAAARETHEALEEDISGFDARAREESDEGGADITGGKLPWFDPSSSLDQDFAAAVFADGLEEGQLLEPVRSSFGWHVIQILYYPTDQEKAAELKAQIEDGADFGELARDYSYAEEAAEDGYLGWVARFQVDEASEEAIFATEVGQLTEPVVVDGDGVHLYRVLAEEVRAPDDEQREQIEQTAFSNWYQSQKDDFEITRDESISLGV